MNTWGGINAMEEKKKVSVSKLSIIAFFSFIVGFLVYWGGMFGFYSFIVPRDKEYWIMIVTLIFQFSALVMGIVDLFKKERRKVLSIITVIISGIPSVLFLLLFLLVRFYTKAVN
jgi:hypothetical protein